MEKSEFSKESNVIDVIELSNTNKLNPKSSFARRALAVTVGGLALFAGAVKASSEFDGSKDSYSLTIADTLPADSTITSTTDTPYSTETTILITTTTPLTSDPLITEPSIVTTTPGYTSDPGIDNTIPTTTYPSIDTSIPTSDETTTTVKILYQDTYRVVCLPLGWVNCAEYKIYNEFGEEVNGGISNSDWSLEYIAQNGGAGVNGYAVKVRDILPCPPGDCY